ncbi:MAG: energy transducer TonB [Pseudomonadota bacterium]
MTLTAGRPISPTPQRLPLLWFVLVSLILHGAVLTGWPAARPLTVGETATADENITLQAVLTRPEPIAEKKTEQPVAAEPKPKRPHTKASAHPKADSRPNKRVAEKTVISTRQNPPATPPSQDSQAEKSATEKDAPDQKGATTELSEPERHRLLGRIRLALAEHFRYPLQARRLGRQGEVVLAFRLESDGRILDARIASSSGYGVLDRAALEALDKVKGIRHEGHRSINLQLPVIYRLEG